MSSEAVPAFSPKHSLLILAFSIPCLIFLWRRKDAKCKYMPVKITVFCHSSLSPDIHVNLVNCTIQKTKVQVTIIEVFFILVSWFCFQAYNVLGHWMDVFPVIIWCAQVTWFLGVEGFLCLGHLKRWSHLDLN